MGASRLENESPPLNSQNMSHKPQRENTHEHLHAHQNLFPTARADRSIRQTKGEKKGRESIKVSMGSPKTKRLDNITAELNTPFQIKGGWVVENQMEITLNYSPKWPTEHVQG